jgi:hypothetical protein
MLKGRTLKPALAAVITITSATALTSLGATAASAATHQARPSSASSDPTDHYLYNFEIIDGFGVPPASGEPYEPVTTLDAYAAVSEGDGYYEWQAHNDADILECITADVNDATVTAEPCGDYPAAQEWNYNVDGGSDCECLYNPYASGLAKEKTCITPTFPGTPYMELVVCGTYASDGWETPETCPVLQCVNTAVASGQSLIPPLRRSG